MRGAPLSVSSPGVVPAQYYRWRLREKAILPGEKQLWYPPSGVETEIAQSRTRSVRFELQQRKHSAPRRNSGLELQDSDRRRETEAPMPRPTWIHHRDYDINDSE
jgi:hypothetical protein